MNKNCIVSWSGGKDSCYALHLATRESYVPVAILNMMNENGQISRSHAIPKEVLQAQADALGLPLFACPATWKEYEEKFVQSLKDIQNQHAYESIIFGDIDLEAHREWEDKVSKRVEVEAVLPLWQQDRKKLVFEMIDLGIEATIVSCNMEMGHDFLGKIISRELVGELEKMGVDACGENGEYHTLVTNCPLYNHPIQISHKGKVTHGEYNFLEFELSTTASHQIHRVD